MWKRFQVDFTCLILYRLFAIHRNALITNAKHIRDLADQAFANKPYRLRLRNGSLICYSTAKSIITLNGHIFDQGKQSVLDTTHTLLLAAIGLAVHTFKHPTTSLVNSDLQVCSQGISYTTMLNRGQLLSTVITFIEQRASTNSETSKDQDLGKLLRTLYADLTTRVAKRRHRAQKAQVASGASAPTGSLVESDITSRSHHVTTPGDNSVSDIDYADPANFDMSYFTDDPNHWPDFLELLDLSSPFAAFSRDVS